MRCHKYHPSLLAAYIASWCQRGKESVSSEGSCAGIPVQMPTGGGVRVAGWRGQWPRGRGSSQAGGQATQPLCACLLPWKMDITRSPSTRVARALPHGTGESLAASGTVMGAQ